MSVLENLLSVPLCIFPGVSLLDPVLIPCLNLSGTSRLFNSSCTILHSHQQCPISPHPQLHLLFSRCRGGRLIMATQVSVRQYLIMFWHACPWWLVMSETHLLLCLLTIWLSSLENCLLQAFIQPRIFLMFCFIFPNCFLNNWANFC